MMSDRLAEIKARLAAIPPGRWSLDMYGCCVFGLENRPIAYVSIDGAEGTQDEAALIAAAPSDIGWLITEVERLQLRQSVGR